MVTLADSLLSSTARRLALRRRLDLEARQHRYQGQAYWVVKEPLGLNYFRFQEEEFALLEMLDGTVSLDDLKEQFEARFPPQKITLDELQQFLGTLHRSNLVVADVPDQGGQLLGRRKERKRKELIGALSNILAIRFKGIDPDRLLTWLEPKLRFLFTRWGVGCALALGLAALTLITVQFDVFQSKLPTFHQFFTLQNAFWLAVALAVTKILHEFGHGLSCKHFGGECHEMGVMILVLTPCLYCNVSDSWMLPNKWQRAAIGAAGMYVELIIASICVFVWWFTVPGLLNHLCLSTIFVCSVSTLIFNGNPLLRYDGYYILSDVIEIPNLRQKSTDILSRKLGQWCLGLERPDDPFLPQRNQLFFAGYSVAAAVYRWVVVFSILLFLYKVFEPYRLQIIGQAIALASIWGLAVQPLWKVGKFFWVPGRTARVKIPRMLASLAVLAAAVLAFFYVPLPYRVFCPLQIKARNPQYVIVSVPGTLDEVLVEYGQQVEPGTPLARLRNLDLELEIQRYAGRLKECQAQLESLVSRRMFSDPTALLDKGQLEESCRALAIQLAEKQLERERLSFISQRGGWILPPPEVPYRETPEGGLPVWTGLPLEPRNRGCLVSEETTLCLVGDPAEMEATLVIDQADIDFVQPGQTVEISLQQLPGHIIRDQRIKTISARPMTDVPPQLSNKHGGIVATKTDARGIEVPLSNSYAAQVLLDNPDNLLRIGLTGEAKIHVRSRTLGQRVWRWFTQTFQVRA